MSRFTLTPSLISTWEKCPRQAYYAHIQKIKSRPGFALRFGIDFHWVILERDQANRISTGQYLPVNQIKEEFAGRFQSCINEIEPEPEIVERYGSVGEAYNAEQKYAFQLFDNYNIQRDVLKPREVEKTVEVEFADTTMVLRYDSIVSDKTTQDVKTKDLSKPRSRPKKKEEIDGDPQFMAQAAAMAKITGEPDQTVEAVYFYKGTGGIDPIPLTFGENQHDQIEEKAFIIHKSIQAGAFYPVAKGSWICTEKWCGYWKKDQPNGFAGCPFGQRAAVSI